MIDNAKKLQLRKIQAFKLIKLNRITEADIELQSLAPLLPKDKKLWLELGRIRINQGRHSEAIELLNKAVTLTPKSPEAHFLLATALQSAGNTHKAISYFTKAQTLDPKNIEILINLGYAYSGINDSKAIKYLNKALSRQAFNPAIIAGLANIYTLKGEPETAYKTLSPLLKKHPLDLRIAVAFADISRPLNKCQQAIELLNSTLTGKHNIQNQCRGHFSLGKLYDQEAEYKQAFKHYRIANTIANQQYNPAQDASFFKGMTTSMDKLFFAETPRAQKSKQHKKLIFIVGMPRTGSTLIEQILATNSRVYAAGELGEIGSIAASLPTEINDPSGYPSCLTHIDENILNKLAQRYLQNIAKITPEKTEIIIDKMPDNFRFLGFIELLFPDAKIIHCKRNPLDTSLSCYFQNFEGGHTYSRDLHNIGKYYRMYEKLIAHWKETLNIDILDIQYEDLIQNSIETSKTLMKFCELDWSAQCLEFFKNTGSITTASFDQVRQPIYQQSINRWKNYEQHLQPLHDGLASNSIEL